MYRGSIERMTLFHQILQMGYSSTPIKIESGQGMGELQKAARNLTLGKIIFILCKEGPLTKYQIASIGNIHKSNLGSEKDIITHRLNDLIRLDMIIKHKPIRIPEGVTGGIKTKYMFTYYLADWDNLLTKKMFLWYRDQFQPTYFYLTEYQELEQELDIQMGIFKYFDKHDPEVLKTVILQEEIADLYSCAEKVKPIDKKTGQVKEGVNLEGMTKCANRLKELKDDPIEYRDNLIQLLKHANIHKEPIAVNDPLVVIRNILKTRMQKLDSRGMLESRGNIYHLEELQRLNKLDTLLKNIEFTKLDLLDLLVQLKIENKLLNFIAVWKRLFSVAPKSEVLAY